MKAPPLEISRDDERATVARHSGATEVIAGPWRSPPKETQQRGGSLICRCARLRLHHLLASWHERIRERRRLRSLSALDDQLLRDIGFTRSELLQAGSKPFWCSGSASTEKSGGRVCEAKTISSKPCRIAYRAARSHLLLPVRISPQSPDEKRVFQDMTRSRPTPRLRTAASPLRYPRLALWVGMVVIPWTITAALCVAWFR
jgi:uncharacterized protein YjiS (DUF1127 family)